MKKRGIILLLVVAVMFIFCMPVCAASEEDAQYDDVQRFVIRLYESCLGRFPDRIGFDDWTGRLRSGEMSGSRVAYGFVFSEEYISSNTTNEEYVTMLYYTFLDRSPDRIGFEDWVGRLNNGTSREFVFNGFANSVEFGNLCAGYGVRYEGINIEGSTVRAATPTALPSPTAEPASAPAPIATSTPVPAEEETAEEADASQTTVSPVVEEDEDADGYERFVERLYSLVLGRHSDAIGLADWSGRLREHRITFANASRGFFNSSEFISRNVSNEEYVRILYRTFLDREPDAIGFADWVSRLENGQSRDAIIEGFAHSVEFTGICRGFGITNEYDQAYEVLNNVGWDIRSAYNWCVSLSYVRSDLGEANGTHYLAGVAFTNRSGNCYCYSAAFVEMARVLGYECYQMSGYVPRRGGGQTIHSWVEIYVDGTLYCCDPDFEYSTHYNGYMFHYGQSMTWMYSNYHRMV